jgi:hypothetical protein
MTKKQKSKLWDIAEGELGFSVDKHERTHNWRDIFGDLVDDKGCYEMSEVNIYQLASHLEELYLKITELEAKLNER